MTYISKLLLIALVVSLAGLFPFQAFADTADANAWNCADGAHGLNRIFCGMTTQFRFLPKLLAIFAYVFAAVLAVQAMLQLKEYGDDPSKTPLQSIIIKLVLAAALISLPFAMQTFITAVTGASDMETKVELKKPSLGNHVGGK